MFCCVCVFWCVGVLACMACTSSRVYNHNALTLVSRAAGVVRRLGLTVVACMFMHRQQDQDLYRVCVRDCYSMPLVLARVTATLCHLSSWHGWLCPPFWQARSVIVNVASITRTECTFWNSILHTPRKAHATYGTCPIATPPDTHTCATMRTFPPGMGRCFPRALVKRMSS